MFGSRGLSWFLVGECGIDDSGIDDRALTDLDTLGLEVTVDLLEELLTQVVLPEGMAELQDGRFIRHRLRPKIDTDKAAHGLKIVQCLFRPRIREIEPLLEEIDAQHALKSPPAAGRSRP